MNFLLGRYVRADTLRRISLTERGAGGCLATAARNSFSRFGGALND